VKTKQSQTLFFIKSF